MPLRRSVLPSPAQERKIKRKHAYHSHILTKKTTKQKRNLCYSGTVSAADEAKIKNLLVK